MSEEKPAGKVTRKLGDRLEQQNRTTTVAKAQAPALAAAKEARAGMRGLAGLLMHGEGYFRAIPDADLSMVFLKWKWTRGPLAAHYVGVRTELVELDEGVALLLEKVSRTMDGTYKPTRDRVYEPGD